MSSPSPLSQPSLAPVSPTESKTIAPQMNPLADGSSRVVKRDPPNAGQCRCCHLEVMFPRWLTLDAKQMDDFCTMRQVKGRPPRSILGRMYMESLHLKEFLDSPIRPIASQQNDVPLKGSGNKQGARKEVAPTRKKRRSAQSTKNSDEIDEEVVDNRRLAQAYFGGLEGKRTSFLANSHTTGKGGGVAESYCQLLSPSPLSLISARENSTSTTAKSGNDFDRILLAEVKLKSLRKAMRLHDHSVPCFGSSENDQPKTELAVLESFVNSPHGYTPNVKLGSSHGSGDASNGSCAELPTIGRSNISKEVLADLRHKSSNATKNPSPDIGSQSKNEHAHAKKTNGGRALSGVPAGASKRVEREVQSSSTFGALRKKEPSPRKALPSNKRHAEQEVKNSNDHPESNVDVAMHEGKAAAVAANMMLDSFRRNRRKYWAKKLNDGTPATACAWCPTEATSGSKHEFGAIAAGVVSPKEEESDRYCGATGDALIQCLECDLVGCAPVSINGKKGGHQHIMMHFLMSGHQFGVTCGPLGQLFCFGCKDIVHHECFDQERERLFLEHKIPSLCWKETPILRGVDASSFIATPENGVVWCGMRATYPSPVSTQFVQAARYAARRSSIFHGDVDDVRYHQCHLKDRCILSPVGLHNLGNSCFMNATLQCLIHCKPLQELFLRNLTHPYQSCECLRYGSDIKSCLTCEMDKIFLEYQGSAAGIDTIGVLEDDEATLTCVKRQIPEKRGHPFSPASLFARILKDKDMHSNRDAKKFFTSFVQRLASHDLTYQQSAQKMRQSMLESKSPLSDKDLGITSPDIRKIFSGTLRSVFICQSCSSKRAQTESFLTVSLPLVNSLSTSSTNIKHGNQSVLSLLDHFTSPRALVDPIYCPSCNAETKTLKQCTFSNLPKVLCLHLDRLDTAANKNDDVVACTVHNLDMGKHLPHWREQGLEVNERMKGEDSAKSPEVMYDLCGTVNHKGTLHQGHYTANVKCGNQWYFCNDASISSAGADNGKNELSSLDACMLFYMKK